jgi:predicted lipid-binding transport protein (Tim44 family)
MARNTRPEAPAEPPQGRIKQVRAVFTMTRKADPAVVWWMLGSLVGGVVIGYLIGLAVDHPIYVGILGLMVGVLGAVAILGRRAERAAFSQIGDQKGAAGYAMKSLRRGWNVEEQPIAIDPRSQDLVFRAVGRPGVVLVTEGPTQRVNRLAENERKRMARILKDVPVIVINAGDAEGQVPLRKLSRVIMRKKPVLTKAEVSEVAKRLRALGTARLPIPKGVDPTRMRPDRKATKGR